MGHGQDAFAGWFLIAVVIVLGAWGLVLGALGVLIWLVIFSAWFANLFEHP